MAWLCQVSPTKIRIWGCLRHPQVVRAATRKVKKGLLTSRIVLSTKHPPQRPKNPPKKLKRDLVAQSKRQVLGWVHMATKEAKIGSIHPK